MLGLLAFRALACPPALAQAPAATAPAKPAVDKPAVDKPAAEPPAMIEGFRQVHFGLNETQLRQAIRKDFPNGDITLAVHPTEKTTILSLTETALLPDTGAARISYILGYQSKKLIEVNIVWTSDGKSTESDQTVIGTANLLRDYFSGQNFKPDSIVRNQRLADGGAMIFRASDASGRTVALALHGAAAADRTGKTPVPPPLTLELAYIEDGAHPDVFAIKKGQF